MSLATQEDLARSIANIFDKPDVWVIPQRRTPYARLRLAVRFARQTSNFFNH